MSWLWLVVQLNAAFAIVTKIDDLAACGPDLLCQEKDPQNFPEWFNPNQNNITRCYCDGSCSLFGDCCMDRAAYQSGTIKDNTFSCVPISHNQSVYAITSCIEDYRWKQICEKKLYVPQFEFIQDIPIYSNLTKSYYANIFCVMCDPRNEINQEITRVIKLPKFKISCTTPNITSEMFQKGEYMSGELIWRVGSGYCAYVPEGKDKSGRPCVRSVNNCPADSVINLSTKCDAYSLLISVENKIYKNPHCALCNGVDKTNISCDYNPKINTFSDVLNMTFGSWDFYICGQLEGVTLTYNGRCLAIFCEYNDTCKIMDCAKNYCAEEQDSFLDYYLTYISLSVSIVCLLIHVYKSIFKSRFKHIPGKVLNSLAWSLLIAQTFFLLGMYTVVMFKPYICYTVSIIVQYFFLASFFWMNVISIDIWHTFSNAYKLISLSYKKYATYAWGSAAFCTLVSIAVDRTGYFPEKLRPQYAVRMCWFGNWMGLACFFCFPVFTILMFNTTLFVYTIYVSNKCVDTAESIAAAGRRDYNKLVLYIKLSTIMGISWTVWLLLRAFFSDKQYRYPFTVLIGLQGAFIYFIFDLKIDVMYTSFIRYITSWFQKMKKIDPPNRISTVQLDINIPN